MLTHVLYVENCYIGFYILSYNNLVAHAMYVQHSHMCICETIKHGGFLFKHPPNFLIMNETMSIPAKVTVVSHLCKHVVYRGGPRHFGA